MKTAIEARLIDTVEQKISSKVKDTAKVLQEDVAEKMEIERRKINLIFHGVKETTDATSDVDEPDLEMIKEVINQGLHMDAARHVESVVRIGKLIEGKTRPVRVKFNTQESRNNVLKRAKDLKDSNEFKRIYVSPDLTRKQQLIDKDLRDHVKQFS